MFLSKPKLKLKQFISTSWWNLSVAKRNRMSITGDGIDGEHPWKAEGNSWRCWTLQERFTKLNNFLSYSAMEAIKWEVKDCLQGCMDVFVKFWWGINERLCFRSLDQFRYYSWGAELTWEFPCFASSLTHWVFMIHDQPVFCPVPAGWEPAEHDEV